MWWIIMVFRDHLLIDEQFEKYLLIKPFFLQLLEPLADCISIP